MEEWKDEIMNSLEGMEKAKPQPDAFFRIQQKISQPQLEETDTTMSWLAIAAAISLIIISNVYFINDYLQKPAEPTQEAYPTIISTYSFY